MKGMKAMELIDRYVYAVTQKLPQEQREDIAEELRGLIEDMLEEKVGTDNISNNDVEEVLIELGNPRKLADKYRGVKRYLIGPEIFDKYLLVLKIILIVVAAANGIGFVIQTIIEPYNVLEYFVEMIVSLVTEIPMAFGWTTFGFVMADLYGGLQQKDAMDKEWTPTSLPAIPDKKRQIKRSEPIIGIIIYTILLVFLAFSSEYFGIWIFDDGFKDVIPFLKEQPYGTYLLFIILIFGIGIIKECLKLLEGKWTYKLATFTTIVNVISLVAILLMVTVLDFWNPSFVNELVEVGVIQTGTDAFRVVSTIWNQLTLWIFIFLIIGLIWDAIYSFVKARKK